MKSPVAFFVYNRVNCAHQVWNQIRLAQPPVLLLVADGPVDEADQKQCDATRAMFELIDWPCDVRRNFAAENMGCRKRISTGLAWVFEQVEEAIVLEDDCLPSPSFFIFCDELLEYYRDDVRVMHIAGANYQRGVRVTEASYFFSNNMHCWGWATWRRAWKYFDIGVKRWPEVKGSGRLKSILPGWEPRWFWSDVFERQYLGRTNSWAYSWLFALWVNHGLAIVPVVNLVSNIGVGAGATHRQDKRWYMNMPACELGVIRHPQVMMVNAKADLQAYKGVQRPSVWTGIRGTVLNPWLYGSLIRRIPFIGKRWTRMRDRIKRPKDGKK